MWITEKKSVGAHSGPEAIKVFFAKGEKPDQASAQDANDPDIERF